MALFSSWGAFLILLGCNVSLNSKPEHLHPPPPPRQTPGEFIERANSPASVHKESAKKDPQGAKTLPLRQLFSKIQQKRIHNTSVWGGEYIGSVIVKTT